jgi:hypothetical protein
MTTLGLAVLSPADGAVLLAGQPLNVAGRTNGKGGLEPVTIDTVTVSLGGGPTVEALLVPVPHQPSPTYTWTASVTTPGPGTYQLVVTAVADDTVSTVTRTRTVTVQGAPAIPKLTPQRSLEFSVTNPDRPGSGDWASDIIKANRSDIDFTLLDAAVWLKRGDQYPACSREWNQVVAPDEDYDLDTAGFSGWLLEPELSGADVPFTHPFGNDWECMVALDPPYAGLLAPGNAVPDGEAGAHAISTADDLGIPDALGMTIAELGGLFAVETDSRCVPTALQPPFGEVVRPGDRIAAIGRWIVDAGHAVEVEPNKTPQLPNGGTSYRSEVHPPLLMAVGGTRVLGPTDVRTRVVLTSRPFLVRQVYTTDTDTINDDTAPDDGTLLKHLDREVAKLRPDPWHLGFPDSVRIEVHPKIAAKPFAGVHLAKFTIRPPDPGPLGNLELLTPEVSFGFTCRSGVGVQVVGSYEFVNGRWDASTDVYIALSDAGYHPAPLPPRQEYVPTDEQLQDAADLISLEEIVTLFLDPDPIAKVNIEQALIRGMVTDAYDVPQVDLLNRSHGVGFVHVNQIPAGQGILIDDGQPYPVFGWLDIRWHRPDVVLGGL